jgi:hypothetical protein
LAQYSGQVPTALDLIIFWAEAPSRTPKGQRLGSQQRKSGIDQQLTAARTLTANAKTDGILVGPIGLPFLA